MAIVTVRLVEGPCWGSCKSPCSLREGLPKVQVSMSDGRREHVANLDLHNAVIRDTDLPTGTSEL